MTAYFYYISHTFINCFKKLFRTWVAAMIGIILLFGIIGGIIGGAVGSYVEDNTDEPYTEEYVEESVEIPPEDFENIVLPIIEMVAFAVPFGFIFAFFYTGDKSGASIFNMSDVNFLFASPRRPQSILCFKSFIQMGAVFLSSLYLGAQIPNLVLNLGLTVAAAIVIVLAFILCIILGMLTSVCTYTIVASKPSRKKWVTPIAVAVLLLVALILFLVKHFGNLGWFDTLKLTFASRYSRFFPIFGWMAYLVVSAVKGNYLMCLLMLLAIIAFTLLIFYFVWRIDADFYEDAVIKANDTFEKQQAALEGKKQRKKPRKEIAKPQEIGKGWGANAFFFKQMHIRRRNALLGLFSKSAVTYMLISVGAAAAVKFILGGSSFTPIAITLLVIHFFKNFGSPLDEETGADLIFTAPISRYKSVFWLLLSGFIGAAIDALPGFALSYLLLGESIGNMIMWFAVFVTFDTFSATTGLAVAMIMPSRLPAAINAVFCIYLRMLLAVPGLVLLIIGLVSGNIFAMGIWTLIINLICSAACFFIGSALLKK